MSERTENISGPTPTPIPTPVIDALSVPTPKTPKGRRKKRQELDSEASGDGDVSPSVCQDEPGIKYRLRKKSGQNQTPRKNPKVLKQIYEAEGKSMQAFLDKHKENPPEVVNAISKDHSNVRMCVKDKTVDPSAAQTCQDNLTPDTSDTIEANSVKKNTTTSVNANGIRAKDTGQTSINTLSPYTDVNSHKRSMQHNME